VKKSRASRWSAASWSVNPVGNAGVGASAMMA
jgi:hypothetical protein